jgi:NTP pyrophosphatase (non-canonical NTP hydrolase)
MDKSSKEVMLIAQEECAEVIQAISKIFRFGIDEMYNGRTNRQRLEEEAGDLVCMIEMMMQRGIIDQDTVYSNALKKRDKLEKWSGVFKEEKVLQNA